MTTSTGFQSWANGSRVLLLAALTTMLGGGAFGYVITDTTGWIVNTNTSQEVSGCTSLDNSGKNKVSVWADGEFPVVGKKYLIRNWRLRSPTKTSAADKMWYFAGDTLAIDSNSDVALLGGVSAIKYNFNDFRWYTGGVTSWIANDVYIGGNVCVGSSASSPFTLTGRKQSFNIYSTVTSTTDSVSIFLHSENNGLPSSSTTDVISFGRFNACFYGDASRFRGTITVQTNTTIKAAGAMPVTVVTKNGGWVSSCGSAGNGAVYKSVDLVNGAKIIVPGDNVLSVDTLTVAKDAAFEWQAAADGSLGTLYVTNSLTLASGVTPIVINVTGTKPCSGDKTTFDLLKVPKASGLALDDVKLVEDVGDIPMLYGLERVEEGDYIIFRIKVLKEVRHIKNDNNEHSKESSVYGTSMTNKTSWSDGELPHGDAVYVVPSNTKTWWYLRTPEDAKTMPVFPAPALYVGTNCHFALRSSIVVTNLVMSHNSTLYFSDATKNVKFGGKLALPESATDCVRTEVYMNQEQIIGSEIVGKSVFKVDGRSSSGRPCGILRLEGLNTNFTGRVLVTIATTMTNGVDKTTTPWTTNKLVKCPYLASNLHERLKISDARNLGGKMSAFTYNGLQLEQMGELETTKDVTIAADSNRGLLAQWIATLTPSTNTTLAVNTPVTYAGRLRKCGPGTLALGGQARFVNGKETTAPTAGTNVLEVIAGNLKATATNALDGVAVIFTNGTRWVVSAAATGDFKAFGAVNTRSTLGGFSSEATDGMIDVAFGDIDGNAMPDVEVALCTLSSKADADALVGKLRVAKPYKGGVVETTVRENEGGTATVVLRAHPTGLTFFVR